ncbi:MAG: ABC transporter ATP-binding protein [Daejeonella sp.]|uniref:ABC transporter ATP-binding protein n=1 Tax=Daejeonella sp. TaxID=2805397 RepID=UPI002734FFE1|nr:ABC transporter ATP-binding protein [Daejeonella sp.]MDP3467724.1 ABC transporter ATP-binding protein [Daejeonella sp.]
MAKVSGNAVDISLLRRIFRYVTPYRNIFIWSIVLTVLLAILAPLRPWLVQFTLDRYILLNDNKGLIDMSLLMLGLLLVQTVVQYFHTFLTNILGQSVIKDLRVKVFNHISSLRLKYFDRTPLGQLITRTVSDLETIADIFSEGLIVIVGDILQVIAIIAVMLYVDWELTMVVLIPMPLLIMASLVFKEAIKSAFQDVRTQVANLNTFLQEHITGIRIIQYFAREDQEMKKFKLINSKHRDAHIRSNWYYSIFFPVVEIISAVSIGLLVWYGSKSILADEISPGVVVSFIMYINMLFRPIRELADKFNTLQMGMVGAERIFNVLDTDEQTVDKGTLHPEKLTGEIEFKNVWFAYNDENWVLKDISFHVKPGETLALVGATGAGKSSIINILNRFYEINKGSILVDGNDIRDYKLSYLRSHIATVLQDVFLFSDSIANNINLSNEEISREKLILAAKEVGAYEFIMKLPGGFDYDVMERGATLSAGQAQLISFIRAMVYDPQILVLDEATASVDTETEELIQHAINKLMQGRTSIVIAHRLSTIQNADRIIVLDHGEIKEMGSHQQLLKLNGYYRKLYELQFSSEGIAKP